MGVIGWLYASIALPPGNSPITHCIGGWVGLWRFWRRESLLPLSGIQHLIVQYETFSLFRLRYFGCPLLCTVSVLFVFKARSYPCGAPVKIAEFGLNLRMKITRELNESSWNLRLENYVENRAAISVFVYVRHYKWRPTRGLPTGRVLTSLFCLCVDLTGYWTRA
jgi:hypothetical protein